MITVYPYNTLGHADHGWLNARHHFSFARYYNPDRVGFGTLLVINDDIVAAGRGFAKHPHDNMEIITNHYIMYGKAQLPMKTAWATKGAQRRAMCR